MTARRDIFLDKFGSWGEKHYSEMDVKEFDQFRNTHEYNQYKARHVKDMIESTVTLDNLDAVNRAQKIIYSAQHFGTKKVMEDVFPMDGFNPLLSNPHLNPNSEIRAKAAAEIPSRTVQYDWFRTRLDDGVGKWGYMPL